MTDPTPTPADLTLPPSAYERMARLLRVGLFAALALLVGALAAYLLTHTSATATQAIASNPILQFLDVQGLAGGLAAGNPAAFLTLGLIVLVATPIFRVAAGLYYFRRGGEGTMTVITLSVLALLLLGLFVIGPLVR